MSFPRTTRSPRPASTAGPWVIGSCCHGSSGTHQTRAAAGSAPRSPRSVVGRCSITSGARCRPRPPSWPRVLQRSRQLRREWPRVGYDPGRGAVDASAMDQRDRQSCLRFRGSWGSVFGVQGSISTLVFRARGGALRSSSAITRRATTSLSRIHRAWREGSRLWRSMAQHPWATACLFRSPMTAECTRCALSLAQKLLVPRGEHEEIVSDDALG